MHADEVDTDPSLVRRMLAAQFPQWAELRIEPVPSAGTDNALYRLGDDMVVRMPRMPWAAGQVDKEQRWLPVLAPRLPLAVPVPLAKGLPAEGYPWSWSVYRWLEGVEGTVETFTDPCQAAADLAEFVAALQRIDPAGGPAPGKHNVFRGVPLAHRDSITRTAIASLHGTFDCDALSAAWEADLRAPPLRDAPVWIHGDLKPGNLLAVRGQLTAVIDFGCLAVGDPACELSGAWLLFSAKEREVFRTALGVDDATWARGRGWALSIGLVALPYYRDKNAVLAEISRRTIEEVLADHARG